MIIQKAWKDLSHHKTKTILTILGLAIAVIGTTGFSIASNSITESLELLYGESNLPDAEFFFRNDNWDPTFLDDISGIKEKELGFTCNQKIEVNGSEQYVTMNGVEMERVKSLKSMTSIVLEEGEWPKDNSNEIICEISAADALNIKLGDSFNFSFEDETDVELVITGFARDIRSYSFSFNNWMIVWISLNHVRTLMGNSELFNQLSIQTEDNFETQEVVDDLMENFKDNEVHVLNSILSEESSDWRMDILEIMKMIFIASTIIGILLGGVLSATTIQMTISQERKDISLLKVIGAQRKHILSIYLMESIILGLIGSLIGLVFSIGGSFLILNIMKDSLSLSYISFIIPIESMLIGFLIPILTSLLFSIPIIMKVTKISPMEFFHGKSIKKKKQGRSKSQNLLGRYTAKNATRSKGRMVLSILLMSFAIGTVFGFNLGFESIENELDNMINTFPPQVMVMASNDLKETEFQGIMDDYVKQSEFSDDIRTITPVLWIGSEMTIDKVLNKTDIYFNGIDPEADIYDVYEMYEGRWLNENDTNRFNIVLSYKFNQNFLQKDHPIKVGDNVTISNFLESENFTVVGFCSDINNGGLMVYGELSAIQRFNHLEGYISIYNIGLNNKSLDIEIAKDISEFEPIKSKGITVSSISYWIESNKKQIQIFALLGYLIDILGIFVAIIGGINIFTMASLKRQKEIGILKIIGAKPKWIFKSFLAESLMFNAVACIFGMVLGYFVFGNLLVMITSQFFDVKLGISITSVIMAIATALVTGLISPLFPAIKASRTSAIEGLRYE